MRRESTNRFSLNPFADAEPVDGGYGSGPARRATSQSALERIITADDLSVVFQPIVRLSDMKIFAYEALMRCALPEYKNPIALFDRAVRDGCCGRLGRAVRDVAVPLCEGVAVFFNLHPLELEERWLMRPDDPLNFHDRAVYLEVTEAVPLSHFELCKSVLGALRSRIDARLVVDDLGAGYSNLAHIADLEPSVVKLDRALVTDIHLKPRRQTLVRGIVRLCADLGAEVLAEGVETLDEYKVVRDLGVHYVQGYFFARPGYPLPTIEPAALQA